MKETYYALLSSSCKIKDMDGKGKGIVAKQNIPTMSMLAMDKIHEVGQNIENRNLTIKYKSWSDAKPPTSLRKLFASLNNITCTKKVTLHIEHMRSHAFTNPENRWTMYPIIQLCNHGEGKSLNAFVFQTDQWAFLVALRDIQAEEEIVISYFENYSFYKSPTWWFGQYIADYRKDIPAPRFLSQFQSSPWFNDIMKLMNSGSDHHRLLRLLPTFYRIIKNPTFQRSESFAKHMYWIQFYPMIITLLNKNIREDNFDRYAGFDEMIDDLFGEHQRLSLPILLGYTKFMNIWMEFCKIPGSGFQNLVNAIVERFPSIQIIHLGKLVMELPSLNIRPIQSHQRHLQQIQRQTQRSYTNLSQSVKRDLRQEYYDVQQSLSSPQFQQQQQQYFDASEIS